MLEAKATTPEQVIRVGSGFLEGPGRMLHIHEKPQVVEVTSVEEAAGVGSGETGSDYSRLGRPELAIQEP
jgi:hypothetical protein